MTRIGLIGFATLAAFALAGCNNVKQQLGLQKSAPDEFEVVKEAPLSMPPDYALRPPRPGAARPQDTPTVEQAQQTVFGGDDDQPAPSSSNGNAALLQMAGAGKANPDIRRQVDRDAANVGGPKRVTAMQKLHLVAPTPVSTSVVNAPAEAARLNNDSTSGKPLTDGTTPSVQH